MISKSISKHPGTEDTAQQCLGAPGAAPDCQSPASWTDGFVHRYQQCLIRWKLVAPATGNSRNFPSENFTNTFSHSSGIWLFASFTTSLLRVFSFKALKNFLIVKGRELLTDCTPVTGTHCKINYHVVFSPINTPLPKITSTVRSSALHLDGIFMGLTAQGTNSWTPMNSRAQNQETEAKMPTTSVHSLITHEFGVQKKSSKISPTNEHIWWYWEELRTKLSREHSYVTATDAGQKPSLGPEHHSCFRDSDLSRGNRAQLKIALDKAGPTFSLFSSC